MIPAYDLETQQEFLTDSNSFLGKTPLEMVKQFQTAFCGPVGFTYEQNSELYKLRMRLLSEEFNEVCSSETPENLLKELCDLLYVTYGFAISFGWDLDEVFRRVHASNMGKLDETGKPVLRDDGKVLKGDQYKELDLSDLVEPT